MTTLQLLLMVKNGQTTILETLTSYLGAVDRFFIIDTGSTDKTIRLVKDFKKQHKVDLVLKTIDFEGFSPTRNKCLQLAYDLDFTWTLFIDDSYIGKNTRSLKKELEAYTHNADAHCLSVNIHRDSMSYKSKRIVRTASKLKFINDIHEVVYCKDYATLESFRIQDLPCESQLARTAARVEYDIKQLVGKEDARSLYYLAGCYVQLYNQKKANIDEVIRAYDKRINFPTDDNEETFMCHIHNGHLYNVKGDVQNAIRHYLKASLIFADRSGEAYFYVYLVSNQRVYIEKAYKNRNPGKTRLAKNETMPYQIEFYYFKDLFSLVLVEIKLFS